MLFRGATTTAAAWVNGIPHNNRPKPFAIIAQTTTSRARESMVLLYAEERRHVAVIGAGWGGLSAADALLRAAGSDSIHVTVIDAASRVGGLVRDGYMSRTGQRPAEAGQHGFWNNYHNIYRLLRDRLGNGTTAVLSDYAEQGQYSPRGLQAVWPVYRDQPVQLPTGLAQFVYTRFWNLPLTDRLSALPLVFAFSEFDDSEAAWNKYDAMSFRDLCIQLGVSRRCYEEAFEPMILTGLFAPGAQCSAAAALGMAYFFVLNSQNAFDVQWCRGNIGERIFEPWMAQMKNDNVQFLTKTRVTGFQIDFDENRIQSIELQSTDGKKSTLEVDDVILAVSAKALNAFSRLPELSKYKEFQNFANLRGTSVLATRIFLDRNVTVPYSANACYGFDEGIGMTLFDISTIHGRESSTVAGSPGSVIEVDYYHAAPLLVMSDDDIIQKVKQDMDQIIGSQSRAANVIDAAVVRLPEAVNWYFPGSYKDMPDVESRDIVNLYFAGDIARTRHGSWSQEKAFVTGVQAANALLQRPINQDVLPMATDELHVKFGRDILSIVKRIMGAESIPSMADFLR
jgi:uncharacterized protein with NAD-binding domain and iron-sulfur cluster